MSSAPRGHGVRHWLSALHAPAAGRFAPLIGWGIGAFGGGAYWLAVHVWPSSIAVLLSILATSLLTGELSATRDAGRHLLLAQVFYVLLKYNVLMALSAAKLPFAAAPNAALWLILIGGYGASRALLVCMDNRPGPADRITRTARAGPAEPLLSYMNLAMALLIGFAPAMLLGLPGLIGLAAAVLGSIVCSWHSRSGGEAGSRAAAPLAPWIAELCFYLGSQAGWRYV